MLTQILFFILDTICGLLTLVLLVRFAMQWARAPFRNPLGEFVIAATDWMVRPVRRMVPALFGFDTASLLLAWLWQVVDQGVSLGFSGMVLAVSPAPTFVVALLAVLEVAKMGLYLVIGVVVISAVFSWVNPYAPLAGVFNTLTQPLLRPFRRFIPPLGGVDLSPLALLLVLQIALFVIASLRQSVLPLMLIS
ncbi:MAG: YggT family protein [Burkholderiaceae bacterium]|nr:YggT family protein [Sulfuritalea sp.]MCF8174792.1 YggT family protein [Burkholderiaceae bacterium]